MSDIVEAYEEENERFAETIRSLRRQVRTLTDERDDARAEIARAHARANEAARLSANARDDAEALNGVIAELREQIGIVEGDRTTTDAWAVNLAYQHHAGYRLDTASVDPYVAITECLADRETLREFADKAVAGREFYARQVDRLALVRVWKNEDGKGFMFVDDIRAVLREEAS